MKFKLKQHLIYLVGMILVALLVNEGFFVAITLFFIYLKRFPKKYWIYFCVSIFSFGWARLALVETEYKCSDGVEAYEARILRIKKQNEEKQTAIIEIGSEKVYLTYPNSEPKLLPGDVIEVEGQLKKPSNPTVPHQFNFKNYLKTQGIGLTLYATELSRVGHEWTIWQYQYLAANWVEKRYPTLTATYLQSFFLGVRDGMSEELDEAYQDLGIVHLFAISGLHVSLLVGLLQYFLKRIGVVQDLINVMISLFLIAFIIIAGGSASILRAGGMTILAIFNSQFKWKLSSYDILSLIFMINFVINPLQLYQVGFIYSYWITFVLIGTQSILRNFSSIQKNFFLPFLAQIAALPIQLAQTYEFNLFAYVGNFFMIPLVTSCIIPLLLVTLLIPQLSVITENVLLWFEQLNLWCAQWLNIPWIFGELSLTTVIVLMTSLLFTGWWFERKKKKRIWIALIIVFVIILEGQRILKPESTWTILDVGQGESMVVQSAFQSCTIMVDTGGNFSITGETKSIFAQTSEAYLLGEGVRKIDYLILTHEHIDHIGEAILLMERFPVKNLVIGEVVASDLMNEIIEVANQKNTKVRIAQTGDVITCGNQTYTFLQPQGKAKDENDASLVMTLEINDFTAMLTGDIGFEMEPYILKEYSLDKLDVYNVAHHGSKYSNSKTFIEALDPSYGVVSAGRNNMFGHPSHEVVEIFKDLGIPLLTTQDYGSIQFKISRKGYKVYSNS